MRRRDRGRVTRLWLFALAVAGAVTPGCAQEPAANPASATAAARPAPGPSAVASVDGLPPVYAATYDHLGIILWGLEKFKKSLDEELDRLDRYPEFRVGWDHEAYAYDYLAEHAPDVLDRMRSALTRFKGRLGVGSSTYGQPLSAFIGGESNIRQLTMAMDTVEKRLGYALSVYIMSEHPFHAQLPQLLAGSGFSGAILRTHFMMYGHNPEYDAPVGWWRGPDASRIAALPTYRGQGATPPLYAHVIHGPTSTLDNRILTDAVSDDLCPMTLADFRRAFGPRIRPLVATRADDPRSRESLIAAHAGDPNYRWILIEDIFKILPAPRDEFATRANDFKPRMPWGYCGNWIWNRCREAEVRVETAERLAAVGHALGGPDWAAELERAWKDLLVAQHHDIQICGLEMDARRFLGASVERADRVIDGVMRSVAPRVGRGPRRVVFNSLSWSRSEWIDAEGVGGVVALPALGFGTLKAGATGAEPDPPVFDWKAEAPEDLVRARFTYPDKWRQVWEPATVGCLTTPFYEVFTLSTGGFTLLRDRRSGRDLLASPKPSGTLAGLIQGRDSVSVATRLQALLERDRAVLVETGGIGGIPYRSSWTFYRHTRRIDWRGELTFGAEWVGRPRRPMAPTDPLTRDRRHQAEMVTAFNDHEYKLRLRVYPFVGPAAVGARDCPFLAAETDDAYLDGLYWTALSDGDGGVAFFNRGLMGSVREKDGALSAVLAFSLPYIWGTRPLTGRYDFALGILPFTGGWRDADLQRQALEYNFPFVTRDETAERDPLGELWTPYRDRGDGGAILSALYARGGRTHARFYEPRGGRADVAFHWLGHPARLTPVDLRERVQAGPVDRLPLPPWRVQTVAIDRP
jgi:alpha-mannosidase